MVVLEGGAVSYERGTPVGELHLKREPIACLSTECAAKVVSASPVCRGLEEAVSYEQGTPVCTPA